MQPTNSISDRLQFKVLNNIIQNKGLQHILQTCKEEDIEYIVNAKFPDGTTFLHCAVLCNNKRAVETLLRYGAAIDAVDHTDSMPIHYANSANVARVLINSKADINAKDNQGYSILTKAYICENIELLELLIANNADAESTKKYCGIPLTADDKTLLLCGEDSDEY